jgi:hypothetical protein
MKNGFCISNKSNEQYQKTTTQIAMVVINVNPNNFEIEILLFQLIPPPPIKFKFIQKKKSTFGIEIKQNGRR